MQSVIFLGRPLSRLSCLLFLLPFALRAQEEATWLRYPAISPDGTTIVFSYRGDLYKVAAGGGAAVPMTVHTGQDCYPVWSHDGGKVAFASDRYGNFDVFMMPAAGGTAERLTFHSASDIPTDFTPDDGAVTFASNRLDAATNQQFPSGVLTELYEVSLLGGMPRQVLTIPALDARFGTAGESLFYHDRKGYEDNFRKHHRSSVTRDIWRFDRSDRSHHRLTTFEGEDRNPVPAPDGRHVYFLSERSGTYNVWKMDTDGRNPVQLTFLDRHPVRYLTCSRDGMLCFSYNGDLHTFREGETPRKLAVQVGTDAAANAVRTLRADKDITEMTLSPNGKEIAYVFRGELFVASVKEGTTRRITATPEQERSVRFHPDGRSLVYAGERNGSWNIYQSSLVRPEEKYFFQSTALEEKALVATPAEEFQPAYAPDGKSVAFLEERTTLRVADLATGDVRTILPGDRNYSYQDGDQHYAWSPDGKWFLVEFLQPAQWITQAGLVPAAGGGAVTNLTRSGYGNSRPHWSADGTVMTWTSDRDGMKNDASWGGEGDVYALFFTQDAYDRFRLSQEEFDLDKEGDKKAEADGKDEGTEKDEKDEKDPSPLRIDWEGLEDRKARLTIHSSRLADAVLSKDGEKLFYLARFEKGYDLWQTTLRTRETKVLAKLGAGSVGGLEMDKDGKALFLLVDGRITKVKVEDGKQEAVSVKGEMTLRPAEERSYLFEHVWRQVVKKFYREDLHAVDWDFYKQEYARFLPHIDNDYDFAEMLSEMLGELNASHTGARYRPSVELPDKTASLGLFFDQAFAGTGLRVAEVIRKGPLDNADTRIRPGTVIERVDGVSVTAETNLYALLNRKEGGRVLLSAFDPVRGERWEEVVKPIGLGAEAELLYRRWVERCRQLVDSLSGGRIGYVHVRSMNDGSYRTVYEEALGRNAGKEGLVVDTRFNGGGWLHDDLATFLDGKPYMSFRPRGQDLGREPQFKWHKPSIVVMGESNYSDAHMFPYTYKALGIGALVGMPVPGTGTAVWWETLQNGMVFGIPQVGMVGNDGQFLENQQLEPDLRVANEPGEVAAGRDQQLEAAVRKLLDAR